MWRRMGTHLGWGRVLGGLKTQEEEASVGERMVTGCLQV